MFEIIQYKDYVEILFLSTLIYYFSVWLNNDKRHHLLRYFYAYWCVFGIALLFHFPTITAFLLYSSPLVLLLFIIFHQDILQRNFITLQNKSLTAIAAPTHEWIEDLIRAGLSLINNNQSLICVIEHQFDLKPFLEPTIVCKSPIQQNLLTLLFESPHFDHQKLVWCTSSGTLVSINAQWKIPVHHDSQSWQHDALLITLKTDTLVFKAQPETRSFDIITKGILYEGLTANHALSLIKKHIFGISQGDNIHDAFTQKSVFKQQNY